MAITQGFSESSKVELAQGIHDLTVDTTNMALYVETANIGPSTSSYTPTGEVATGNGYTAGGIACTVTNPGTLDNGVAVFSIAEPTWSSATFAARGALWYNASKSNRALGVYDFGVTVTGQGGDFIVRIPPATWNQGFWRIA